MTTVPQVSVIIPSRNEVKYIAACLDSLLANDYPKQCLDVLVVDGMSEDGTGAIVERYARAHPFIRLVHNPRRVTPVALNLGVAVVVSAACTGTAASSEPKITTVRNARTQRRRFSPTSV